MPVFAFQEQVDLESTTCPHCGVVFAAPRHLLTELRRKHGTVYCPSGHSGVFRSETEVERLTKELEVQRTKRGWAENEAAAEKKLREEADAKLARHQKRSNAGVCPHCQRSFKQVARHMASKHPEVK